MDHSNLDLKRLFRFAFVFILTFSVGLPLPPMSGIYAGSGVATALADDDDGGDDDGDDGGGGRSGGSRGGGGSGWDDDDRRPRGDIRSLFRWMRDDDDDRPRRRPQRRAVSVPDRAPNEIVAIGLDSGAIARLEQGGFVIDNRQQVGLTGGEMVRLTVPSGMTLDVARQTVANEAPSAAVDFNHFYRPEQAAGAAACGEKGCSLVRHIVGWPAAPAESACSVPQRIGLIDTAINAEHAAFAGARIEVLRLDETSEMVSESGAQHGTAVAALLVGAPGSRAPGLLPGSELIAIDAFQRYRKTADVANVFDLVKALDMLAARNTRVINLSLTGPENLLLEQAVSAAIGKGVVLVAAAGNGGPNAKPVYPAAYDHVIAVTAIDRSRKAYRRAARGDHIDIAAPGVGVWTAASISGGRQKSGTSFAAPFVTAAAAALLGSRPDLTPEQIAAELTRSAEDIGAPGKDAVYGWGLLDVRGLCTASVATP